MTSHCHTCKCDVYEPPPPPGPPANRHAIDNARAVVEAAVRAAKEARKKPAEETK